jgi:uncharacterized protein (DUF1778 family)
MSRPNQNRTEQVIGLVTPAEKKAIKAAAEEQEETVSDFIRQAALYKLNGHGPAVASTENEK